MSDTALEARFSRLERSFNRWRRLALLCVTGVVCIPFLGQAKPKSTALVVDHFTVRDRDGNPRLVISRGGRISFRNKEGLEVGSLDEGGVSFAGLGPGGSKQTIFVTAPSKEFGASFGMFGHPDTDAEGGGLHHQLESFQAELGTKGPRITLKRHTGAPDRRARLQPNVATHIGLPGVVIAEDEKTLLGLLRPR